MPHPAHRVLASLLHLALLSVPAIVAKRSSRSATLLSIDSVNGAEITRPSARPSGAALLRVQILLNRKAVRIYRKTKRLGSSDRIDGSRSPCPPKIKYPLAGLVLPTTSGGRPVPVPRKRSRQSLQPCLQSGHLIQASASLSTNILKLVGRPSNASVCRFGSR